MGLELITQPQVCLPACLSAHPRELDSCRCSVLRALASARKLTVLVHPVPPVLNETRHIVTLFNRQLVKAVAKEPSLTMLDFFDDLLTPDGKGLADGLALDGTHMHPDYTKVMEKALAKVPTK